MGGGEVEVFRKMERGRHVKKPENHYCSIYIKEKHLKKPLAKCILG